jgi:multisubunit Na+/H+ antiporter MnhG subunit
MKESNSEGPEKEKKAGFSIVSSAKKALNALDPVMEDKDNGSLKDHPEDSKTKKSNKESKNSVTGTFSAAEDAKKVDSPKKEEIPEKSKKTELNSITERFNHYKTLIQEDRKRFIALMCVGVGIVLILLGISLLFGNSEKVSDNVVFGERSVTSAFFIIAGLLIIAAVYAPKIIGKTSFDGIYQEMKGVEDDSSSKKERNNSKEDDIKDNQLTEETKTEDKKNTVKTEISEEDLKKEK